MIALNDSVKIKEPFNNPYTEAYKVISIVDDSVYFLEGIEGGFDIMYLEKVE